MYTPLEGLKILRRSNRLLADRPVSKHKSPAKRAIKRPRSNLSSPCLLKIQRFPSYPGSRSTREPQMHLDRFRRPPVVSILIPTGKCGAREESVNGAAIFVAPRANGGEKGLERGRDGDKGQRHLKFQASSRPAAGCWMEFRRDMEVISPFCAAGGKTAHR